MTVPPSHSHKVQVYYEDTDLSGVVYHANYLKYFERAREHLLGIDELVRLFREDGIGFVVYNAELAFREGAVHGDTLDIRTHVEIGSEYRAIFHQEVWREGAAQALVKGRVELACVNRENRLVPLPRSVINSVRS